MNVSAFDLNHARTRVRTPLGEQLRGPAREVLAAAERLFNVSTPFEPETYDGELVLTTSDRVAEVLLPTLDGLRHEKAPKHVWFRGLLRDAVRVAGLT